jgi:transposase
VARAKASDDQALIAHQQLRIEKLTRQLYGPRSERTSRLLDQIELQFEELESSATEDEIAAEMAVAKTTTVAAFTRNRPARKPFPEHLPRERVILPGPTACLCWGGGRLRKLGETVTETLESIPRQWKVIQHVREKFTCRDCEKISQAPAPFHVIARGWAGNARRQTYRSPSSRNMRRRTGQSRSSSGNENRHFDDAPHLEDAQ